MTLKQKSIFISLSTTVILILSIVTIVFSLTLKKFQRIENQRVERNIKRVSAVINNSLSQIDMSLRGWSIWDDSYYFFKNQNNEYIETNLSQDALEPAKIDEVLYIDKKGALVASALVESSTAETKEKREESDFPEDIYQHFATGSALLKVDSQTGNNSGFIRTEDGLLLFVVRGVYPTSGQGEPSGSIVFAKYLDEQVINSLKDLTQFNAEFKIWDDPQLSPNYFAAKQNYLNKNEKSLVKIQDKEIVAGYLIIEDVYGKPQAIIKSEIKRDIIQQGKSGISLLLWLLSCAGLVIAIINYWLIVGNVITKISSIAKDVENLSHHGSLTSRLAGGVVFDEVDTLREGINTMLDALQKGQSELAIEIQKSESVIDMINSLVVILDREGKIKTINKKGLEILGYKEEEVVGKNWLENFLTDKSKEAVKATFKNIISNQITGNKEVENEVLTKDGKVLIIAWHNSVVKNEQGEVVTTLSIGEDITVKKQELVKKEAYSKELERLNELMIGRELKMVELKKALKKKTLDK